MIKKGFTTYDINLLKNFGYNIVNPKQLEKALDDKQLFNAITEKPSLKDNLSLQLYFLIVVSKYMKELSIGNKNPIFYVADVLTRFTESRNLNTIPEINIEFEHISDLLTFGLKSMDFGERDMAFYALRHRGELALLFSGILYKNLKYKRKALSIEDYVDIGTESFSYALNLKKGPFLLGIGYLSDKYNFQTTQKALKKVADYHMGFDDEIGKIWKSLYQ